MHLVPRPADQLHVSRTSRRFSAAEDDPVRRARRRAARIGAARVRAARVRSARLGPARVGAARERSARVGERRPGQHPLFAARVGAARLGAARLGAAGLGPLGSVDLTTSPLGSVPLASVDPSIWVGIVPRHTPPRRAGASSVAYLLKDLIAAIQPNALAGHHARRSRSRASARPSSSLTLLRPRLEPPDAEHLHVRRPARAARAVERPQLGDVRPHMPHRSGRTRPTARPCTTARRSRVSGRHREPDERRQGLRHAAAPALRSRPVVRICSRTPSSSRPRRADRELVPELRPGRCRSTSAPTYDLEFDAYPGQTIGSQIASASITPTGGTTARRPDGSIDERQRRVRLAQHDRDRCSHDGAATSTCRT